MLIGACICQHHYIVDLTWLDRAVTEPGQVGNSTVLPLLPSSHDENLYSTTATCHCPEMYQLGTRKVLEEVELHLSNALVETTLLRLIPHMAAPFCGCSAACLTDWRILTAGWCKMSDTSSEQSVFWGINNKGSLVMMLNAGQTSTIFLSKQLHDLTTINDLCHALLIGTEIV